MNPGRHWPQGADVVAGLSIAGLLLPEAVAYSGIAGLPPQAGIIGLFAGLVVYGLLGSSRFAIVSATSSSAAVLGAAISSLAGGDGALRAQFAVGIVLAAGICFLLAAAARLGSITDYISRPVLRGFAFGLAVVIIVGQLAIMAHVHLAHPDPLRRLYQLGQEFGRWDRLSLLIGALALVLLFALSRWRALPGGLLVIALGIAAARYFDLQHRGVAIVGPIELSLQAPQVTDLLHGGWLRTLELALALVMVLYSESYGSIRSFAVKHDDEVSPNRDLIALGAANLVSGLFGGMPVGAGYSATAANEAAGARSRWAGGVAAAAMLIVALLILPQVAYTPQAVLAAIVIHAVGHALHPSVFRRYFEWQRDRIVVVVAVVAVLGLGVLDGLLVAVAVSLLMMLRRLSVPSVSMLGRLGDSHDFVPLSRLAQARPEPGLLILRPDEPLFFANVERILAEVRRRTLEAKSGLEAVIVSLEETYDLDGTSLEALRDFAAWVHRAGHGLVLARLKPPVLELLQRAFPSGSVSPLLVERSVDDAVRLARKLVAESDRVPGRRAN